MRPVKLWDLLKYFHSYKTWWFQAGPGTSGWLGLRAPDLAVDVPDHCRGLGLQWPLKVPSNSNDSMTLWRQRCRPGKKPSFPSLPFFHSLQEEWKWNVPPCATFLVFSHQHREHHYIWAVLSLKCDDTSASTLPPKKTFFPSQRAYHFWGSKFRSIAPSSNTSSIEVLLLPEIGELRLRKIQLFISCLLYPSLFPDLFSVTRANLPSNFIWLFAESGRPFHTA